jgi:hypothetical protein
MKERIEGREAREMREWPAAARPVRKHRRGGGGWRRKGELTSGPGLAARGERKGRWEWAGGVLLGWNRRWAAGLARWAEKGKGRGGRGWVFLFFPNLFKH